MGGDSCRKEEMGQITLKNINDTRTCNFKEPTPSKIIYTFSRYPVRFLNINTIKKTASLYYLLASMLPVRLKAKILI